MSPTRRVSGAVAIVTVVAVFATLAGCARHDPPPADTWTPRPVGKSLFATEEEALAVAEEGYRRYLDVVDAVGGIDGDPARLTEVATAEYAEELAESLDDLRAEGLHLEGKSTFDSMKVFEKWNSGGLEYVSVYVCLNTGEVRLIGADGVDRTPPDRAPRQPAIIRFQSLADNPRHLIARGSDEWLDSGYCG